MADTETLTLELPADLVAFARDLAERRGDRTPAAVFAEALALMRIQGDPAEPDENTATTAMMRAAIAEADAESDPPLTDAEVAAHFERVWAARSN